MRKIELLSPASSMEALIPAVRMGADAVYLGLREFSARRKAKNFSKEELKEAIEYCHVRDVKVYLTMNTLIKDKEFDSAIELARFAAGVNVDALIVQDVGFAHVLRKIVPDLKLHGSTQMSVHTPSGVKYLEDMGFSRVVLSRELSRGEIEEIRKSSKMELEVFVHGALCMSVSGQCYLSSMLGGRSGNRGLCAQPCRLPFKARCGSGYDLSLKDLSLIDHVQSLIDIGVNSLKIEGRMKRPEYVASSVKAFREAIDYGKVDEETFNILKKVFSRSGFTDGYYTGNMGRSMFGVRSKEDVVLATNKIYSKIHDMYRFENKNIPIKIEIVIKKGLPVTIRICDRFGNNIEVKGNFPEKAVSCGITSESCINQLKKSGETPFFAEDIVCDVDEGLFVSVSHINFLRRKALSELESKRKIRSSIKFSTEPLEVKYHEDIFGKIKMRARFPDCNVPIEFKRCEFVCVPVNSDLDELLRLKSEGFNICIEIPRVFFGTESEIIKLLEILKSNGFFHVWVGNLGAVKIALDLGLKIHGGFSLNLMNSYSLMWARDVGFEDVEMSFEMNLDNIYSLKEKINRGIIVYGKLPLMITRNCPAKENKKSCINCDNPHLIDRKGFEFPIVCNGGTTEILNSLNLCLSDKMDEIDKVDFVVLRFTVENYVERVKTFKYFNGENSGCSGTSRGLYYRNVE